MVASGFVLAGVGAVVLAGSVAGARHPTIHPLEGRVFHAINGLPGWLYPVLWGPMQLGNLVVGTLAGLAVASGSLCGSGRAPARPTRSSAATTSPRRDPASRRAT